MRQQQLSRLSKYPDSWDIENVLVANAQEWNNLNQTRCHWNFREYVVSCLVGSLGFGLMVCGSLQSLLIIRFFGQILATVVFGIMMQSIHATRSRMAGVLSPYEINLVKVLGVRLAEVDEVRLVPQVLEVARRVPELAAGEVRDTWRQAEEECLGRLLPRMTTGEAQALTEEQRWYLRNCLSRELPEAMIVAILLTLGSAGDQEAVSLAQHFAGQPFPRVQVAAQECLVALRQGATKS